MHRKLRRYFTRKKQTEQILFLNWHFYNMVNNFPQKPSGNTEIKLIPDLFMKNEKKMYASFIIQRASLSLSIYTSFVWGQSLIKKLIV